ncbi:MAG: ABC transporter permease [Acidobacteria bacterium]|nr:ABC transporter permease [Acidobacteriota bacterium]
MKLAHWIYKLPLRFHSLFHRSRVEKELGEEFQYHLDRQIETLTSQGMSPNEARNAALRAMHGIDSQKEKCREARGIGVVEELLADSRYAVRAFAKNPALVLVIVCSIALGIGANTAIFSVINAVSLKMLPVREPGNLVLLKWTSKGWPEGIIEDVEGGGGQDKGGLMSSNSFSSEVYAELKKQNHVFEQMLAFAANDENVNVELEGRAQSAHSQAVSGDFFAALGVSPILGRTMLPSDDTPSSSPVAIVSYDFWRKHFGSDTEVAGKTITYNGVPLSIAGVAPPEFFGERPGDPIDIYIPLSFYQTQWTVHYPQDPLDSPKTWWLDIVGRKKPGVNDSRANAELQVIMERVLRSHVQKSASAIIPTVGVMPAGRGLNDLRERFSTSLLLLMGMVALVLLIACANVAGLLMARASARQKEIAVRLSLGASRARIVRQLLVESLMLSAIGGAAGLLISFWASSALVRMLGSGRNAISLPTQIDLRVLAFTALVSILSGILFGLIPALSATRVNIAPTLKDNAAQFSTRASRFAMGKTLVGAQVALSFLLLTASGLFLRTLTRLQNVNLGFDRHGLVTFEVRPGLNGYSDPQLIQYYEELQRRLQTVAGVRSAAFAQHGPIDSGWTSHSPEIPGYTSPGQQVDMNQHVVGPAYFETLNVPVLLGRAVGPQDTETSANVLVINETAMRKYFHGDNPLGKHLVYGKHKNRISFEIVGVVGDVKYGKIRDDVPPTAYSPYQQSKLISRQMVYLVRTNTDPAAVLGSVQQVCLALNKDVPPIRLQTEEDVVNGSLFLERTFAWLSGAFAALALLLACIGLYGTVAYAVTRRTAEIGIRMALGAERKRILRMIMSETLFIVGAGLLAGLPIAWIAVKLLKHQLYELSPHDPLTIVSCCFAILAIALFAGFMPARRAARVEPIIALRCE